ncbi:MAG: adenylate kinase family protein [Candidatus Methanomethylicus sp.]|nr:adenylate kinase family protein [Candidatus Methanomethylicus sp.]
MQERNSIVITGTPGVGKTTASKLMADQYGFKLIELNRLAKEIGVSEKDEERDSWVINPRRIRAALRKILTDGATGFLIEGHFADLVPEMFVKKAIVLRTNPIVLQERLRQRGYSEEKIKENVEAELVDSCLISAIEAFGEERVVEADTTELEANTLVNVLRDIIDGKNGMPPGSINWMVKLEAEGKLQQLLH